MRSPVLFVLFSSAVRLVAAFAVPIEEITQRPHSILETDDAPRETSHTMEERTDWVISKDLDTPTKQMRNKKLTYSNLRWLFYGVGSELFHNLILRQVNFLRKNKSSQCTIQNAMKCRQPVKNEIAVVSGATGGIGSHIAQELACRGYDVVIAVRDVKRGEELVKEIREMLTKTPVCGRELNAENKAVPLILFVEYHAEQARSALDLAAAIKELTLPIDGTNRRLSLLVNNAGIMGKSKQMTMRVNLLGPVLLTFALLPLMSHPVMDDGECSAEETSPIIINVGSSAHLRATHVIDEDIVLSENETYINAMSNALDRDLSTYAQSKLALMQFSTLLRSMLPRNLSSTVQIYDVHPGLVWTPLLRNHIGEKACHFLQKSGLSKKIYKTPIEGALSVVSSLDLTRAEVYDQPQQQLYFVNGQPYGYSSAESRDLKASLKLWEVILMPDVSGLVEVPDGWGLSADPRSSVS